MSQHCLLSAKARTLSVHKVMELSDDQTFSVFKEVRWGEGEEVGGSYRRHFFISTRKQWRYKDCHHTFSVTSGTIFALHKMPLRFY